MAITLPDRVPIMPLPGALLFPHALLPLYIFEPRYRTMLKHALDDNRMFAVALLKPQRSDWRTTADFHHIATVGLIRACVGRGDGTSNLILHGLRRVRFVRFPQEGPFPIAEIEPLHSVAPSAPARLEVLGRKVLELYEQLRGSGREFPDKVDRYLSDLRDPEMLADLMAATFITDARRRQELLEELSLERRLRLVVDYLSEEPGDTAG